MSCCSSPNPLSSGAKPQCPRDRTSGKPVQLITLKALLTPSALATLDAQSYYRFCDSPNCSVVYFSTQGQIFTTDDLQVPVFQKNRDEDVPVCYCFGWTRQRIYNTHEQGLILESIMAHIKAGRCGCEMNNPQGSCCLGNMRSLMVRSS